MQESVNVKDKVSTPMFMIQGKKDKNVCPEGNIKYFNDCSVSDKVLIEVDDLEHDIYHDYRINKYLEDIVINS